MDVYVTQSVMGETRVAKECRLYSNRITSVVISMFFHMTVLTNSFNLDDEVRFPPVYEHRAGILLRFAPAPMRLYAGEGCCLRD